VCFAVHSGNNVELRGEFAREAAFYNGNGNLCRANVLAKFKVQAPRAAAAAAACIARRGKSRH